jgi:hypothetical protein
MGPITANQKQCRDFEPFTLSIERCGDVPITLDGGNEVCVVLDRVAFRRSSCTNILSVTAWGIIATNE